MPAMKTRMLIAGVVVLCGVMAGCTPPASRETPAKPAATKVETPTPVPVALPGTFTLERIDGEGGFALSGLSGKPALVHVFGPWTDSGRGVADRLRELAGTGLPVLPVMVDRRDDAGMPDGIMPDGWSGLPVVKADETFLTSVGGVRALPTTVMLDAEGRVVRSWPGHVAMSNLLAGINAPARAH